MTPLPDRHLRVAAVGLAVAACAAAGIGVGGQVQAVAVLGFFLVGPGLAVTPWMKIEHRVGQAATAVGVSLATLIIVSEALVYARVSSAGWVLALSAAATMAAAVPPLLGDRR